MSDQPKPTGEWTAEWLCDQTGMSALTLDQSDRICQGHNAALAAATGQKCPTCGYQLVVLDNDELAKLTEKAAYHELREQIAAEQKMKWELAQQLAAEREAHNTATETHGRALRELDKQLAAEREQLATVRELREHDQKQLAAEKGALADMARTNEKLSAMLAALAKVGK